MWAHVPLITHVSMCFDHQFHLMQCVVVCEMVGQIAIIDDGKWWLMLQLSQIALIAHPYVVL